MNFKKFAEYIYYNLASKRRMVFIIKPISAKLSSDKDWIGKSVIFLLIKDPYCVISIGN